MPGLFRHLLSAMAVAASALSFAAASDLPSRVAEALAQTPAAAALPAGAVIEVAKMTPVRGDVLEIEIDTYDPRSGHFTADVIHGPVRKGISGRAPAIVEAVVATRTIRPGETLSPDDLTLAAMPVGQVPQGPVTAITDAAGMSAKTSIPAGRAVAADALRPQLAIRRNDPVTLAYESDYLRLTARGKALGDGAPGEIVAVLNATGGSVVEGRVAGPGLVRVEGGL